MLASTLGDCRVFLGLVVMLAVAVRAVVLPWGETPSLWSDQGEYDAYAWNLAQGRGYAGPNSATRDQDHLTARRMPGPSLIAAGVYKVFGHRYSLAVLVNVVLMSATCIPLFLLGARLFDERVARWSAVVFALWPHGVYLSTSLLSEPLFVFFWYLFILHSLWLARRPSLKHVALSGVLLGCVIYMRPHVIFLPFVALWAVLVFWGSWSRIAACASVFLVVAAMLIPWAARNYRVFHAFIPLATQGPLTLLAANNRITASDPTYYGSTLSWEGAIPEYNQELAGITDEVAHSRRTMELAKDWLLTNRDKWGYLIGSRFVKLWSPFLRQADWRNRLLMLGTWGPVVILFVWPFSVTLFRYARDRDPRIMVHLAILSIVANALIFSGLARYRFPMEGLCIVFACSAALSVWDRVAGRGQRRPEPVEGKAAP